MDHKTFLVTCVIVLVENVNSQDDQSDQWQDSQITSSIGHYPTSYCTITNLMLIPSQDVGYFFSKNDLQVPEHCPHNIADVWKFKHDSNLVGRQCDETFDKGYIFTFFYYLTAHSNYFHLHYDTMIPLYKQVYHNQGPIEEKIAFLPTVETRRLQDANWKTDAFSDKMWEKYWAQMIRLIAGSRHSLLALNNTILEKNKTICFKEAHFGTASWSRSPDPSLMLGFIKYIQSAFSVIPSTPTKHKIGIIKRDNRRRILNEQELVDRFSKLEPTELVDFVGKSFKQQVEMMQQYTVIIGMNGAGLMNCLYLPPHSTTIQLVPYKADVNFIQFGNLLKTRGPYLEWHNTHEENAISTRTNNYSQADTIVDPDELEKLVKEAIELVEQSKQNRKVEL